MRPVVFLSTLVICSCGVATTPTDDAANPKPVASLQDDLRAIEKAGAQRLEDVRGDTPAQKLLYLMDSPASAKAGILVGVDGVLEGHRQAGNLDIVEQLEGSRVLMVQAADEHMDEFIRLAAAVYEARFTEEELERLAILYADPVMQKLVSEQVPMMADLTEEIEAWGMIVGKRYAELVEEQGE